MNIPVTVYTELILLMKSSKPARNMQRLIIGNKLIVNGASCWFILYGYITIHGQQNIKSVYDRYCRIILSAMFIFVITFLMLDIVPGVIMRSEYSWSICHSRLLFFTWYIYTHTQKHTQTHTYTNTSHTHTHTRTRTHWCSALFDVDYAWLTRLKFSCLPLFFMVKTNVIRQ